MSKTILLADDSVTIRKVVELTFMDEDYDLDSVGSGEEAIASLDARTPDLVIADVHMPGVNGYEVCRRAKEIDTATPVLLLVGTFEPFDPSEVEDCGGDRFLKKPFDSQELLRTVRELLGSPVFEEDAETESETQEVPVPADLAETVLFPVAAMQQAEPPAAIETEQPVVEQQAPAEAAPEPAIASADGELSDESVDRIARRVVELLSDEALRDVAWEVVPDLAEVVIKERLRELESQVE